MTMPETPPEEFIHRPISVTIDDVSEMEVVRTQPATETRVIVNVKFTQKAALALFRMLAQKINLEQEDLLLTFSFKGKMK